MSYTLTSYRYLHSRVALFEELAIEMYFGLRPFDGLTREERTFVFEQLGLLAGEVNRVTRPPAFDACEELVADVKKTFESFRVSAHHGRFDLVRLVMGNFLAVVKRMEE
ncbi:uncharacterized protein IWZ02DRAFT_437179 [Phyllosticta citriasiana]|uniref:uncharacterized protein n=1 Tax=Phyllosticta citriasiana TaxID=595635 RepID=UPI0030FDDD92